MEDECYFDHSGINTVRSGKCECCQRVAVLMLQPVNRSTAMFWGCEECCDEEQKEVDAAWAEYYSGCL